MPFTSNISFDSHGSASSLSPQFLEVLRAIYQHVDAANIPAQLDPWRYKLKLVFPGDPLTHPFGDTLLRIYEYVWPKGQMLWQMTFQVNLALGLVFDKRRYHYFLLPASIARPIGEIRRFGHIRLAVARNCHAVFPEQSALLDQAEQSAKISEPLLKSLLKFLTLLSERGILGSEDMADSYAACPVCRQDLLKCRTCDQVACGNGGCRASQVSPIVRCGLDGNHYDCVLCQARDGHLSRHPTIECHGLTKFRDSVVN